MDPITETAENSDCRQARPRPCILTISASDSSGGSGIQADQRAIAGLGGHALCAITAVTAQYRTAPAKICPVDLEILHHQIEAALGDFPVAAVKIGLLPNREILKLVGCLLADFAGPVVLDPVFVASSGSRLAASDVAESMVEYLGNCVALVTPNLDEAGILCGQAVADLGTMRAGATALKEKGWRAVLIKGGHLPGSEIIDLLATRSETHEFRHRRVNVGARGTGCTLSSALAVCLGQKQTMKDAVEQAGHYVARAMATHYCVSTSAEPILPCMPDWVI